MQVDDDQSDPVGTVGGGAITTTANTSREATVVIIGAGPAGLGTAALLQQCGVECIVLERGDVGQTFKSW